MKKQFPKFDDDAGIEQFLENDLSSYLVPENLRTVTFEFEAKEKVVNLRMSSGLLEKIKQAAKKKKMPYQKYIRRTLELSLKQ
jgi:predicted DNA binding CopG/RHH family protein